MPGIPEPLRRLPKQHPATWQRVLLEEFRSIPDLQLHIISVRRHYERHYRFELDGVTFHCLKLPRGMRTLSLFWWETFLIRHCLKTVQPDLVHAWGTERGAAMVASRLRYPYVVTMQGLLEWCLELVDLGPLTQLEARFERISLRRASVVTVESTFGRQWLKERYPHLTLCQAEHASNWLFHRLTRQPETSPLRFLFVGLICELKGGDLLIKALDRLRTELDFKLIVVGSGKPDYLAQLKAVTSQALWDRIEFRQGLSPAQVGEELSRATMMLFPTRADNSPNSVKEAVVAGVPVVASAIGGIVDYVVPDRNGLLFPSGNLEEFVSAIRRAAQHPLLSRGTVDSETLASRREYLSPRVMAEKFLAAYREALKQRPPGRV